MIQTPPKQMTSNSIIRTVDLSKTYYTEAGPLPVLHEVNFTLDCGEFVAIMGPSGCGKTTFMNILGVLDQPTSGQYFLLDKAVESLSPDEMAGLRNKFLGFIFQGFSLMPRADLVENVGLPLLYSKVPTKERRERARAMLSKVGLDKHGHHHPNQISGGQQQRVAIARALICNPSLILADEPTGNLDSQTTEEILSILYRLNDEGMTIIMVTHEPDVASFAKRLLRFYDGRQVEDSLVVNRRCPKC